jgi:hypothetical protein
MRTKETRSRIEKAISDIEKKIANNPTSVKAPLWKLKIEDLQNDLKQLESGKFVGSQGIHRTGLVISPPSGNFNRKR